MINTLTAKSNRGSIIGSAVYEKKEVDTYSKGQSIFASKVYKENNSNKIGSNTCVKK